MDALLVMKPEVGPTNKKRCHSLKVPSPNSWVKHLQLPGQNNSLDPPKPEGAPGMLTSCSYFCIPERLNDD